MKVMSPTARIILNTLATYGRSVFAIALGLFSTRWVLVALGKSDLGLFGLVGSIVFIVGILNGIMSAAVSRYYAFSIGLSQKENEGDDEIVCWFNAAISIHTFLPLVLVAIGYPIGCYAIRHWLVMPPERIDACVWVFRLVLFSAFVNMISVPYIAMYRAKQLIAELSFWGMLQTCVMFICAYFLMTWNGDRLVAYAGYMTIFPAIITGIQVQRAWRQFDVCRLKRQYLFRWECIRKLFVFASGELFGWIGGSVRDNGIPFLINLNFGPGVNAAFTIANQVSAHTASLSSAMMGAVMPAVTTAEGAGGGKAATLSFKSIKFGVALIALFCIPVMLELEEVLRLWLVNPPEHTVVLCRCIIVSTLCAKFGWGYHLAILAKGKIVFYQLILGSTAAFGFCLAWIFIHLGMGVSGVGYAYIAIFTIMTFERACFASRLCAMSINYWAMKIVFPLVVTISVTLLVGKLFTGFFNPSVWRVCGTSAVCGILFLMLCWGLILLPDEKVYLMGLINRTRKAIKINV